MRELGERENKAIGEKEKSRELGERENETIG